MADQQPTEETNVTGEAPAGGSWTGKLALAGFMGGVIAVECLLAYLFIPSADEVAALAEANMAKKLPAALAGGELVAAEKETKPTVEVDLGEYSITVSQPNSSTALRVDFHLFGTVLEKDVNEMKALYDRHVHRFRDMVLVEIRNSEPSDLADPGLGLIKRRILEKSNDLFGKPILRSVVFSDFSYIEQ